MKCEECGSPAARRCVTCGRVSCRDHGAAGCPTCGRSVVTATPPAPRLETGTQAVPPRPPADAVCVVCGESAVAACARCGAAYCVHHRGVQALPGEPPEEGEEGPIICWLCRLSSNAKAVLFWVVLGMLGAVALIYFFSFWT